MYRIAYPTRLVVYGGLALVLVFSAAGTLSFTKSGASPYVWAAGGVIALVLAVAVRRRLTARASEYLQLDDAVIASFGPARWDVAFGGYTALERAAWQGETEMVRAMLDTAARIPMPAPPRTRR